MVTPTHRGTGMRVSAPCMMLNLKSFLLFSIDLLSRGGGGSSNTGLSTFVDFFFWKKLFSFWCNTLEWWSLHLHFPVQQCLVYVWWLNGTCKDSFVESAFLQWFSKSHQVIQYAIELTVLRLCNGRFVLPFWGCPVLCKSMVLLNTQPFVFLFKESSCHKTFINILMSLVLSQILACI